MRATVVVQDRTVWLSGGGPLLCVLLVSGAVRKRCSPEPTGNFKPEAGDTMGGNGGAAGEAAEGTGTGLGRGDTGGGGEDKRYEDDGRDVGRGDNDRATGPCDESLIATAGRGSRRDGGGGVVASSADDG